MTNIFNGHVTLWFAVPHHRGQHAANFGSFRSCGSGVKTFLICHVS